MSRGDAPPEPIDEYTLVIDSLRTIQLHETSGGAIVLTVEDPGTVAIVEMSKADLAELGNHITRRLSS